MPPIDKLEGDLLWAIFSMNAQMFQYDEALKTTQAASQVCSIWRNLLTSSPSIWARLIDLDVLFNSSPDWLSEVLRRSGQALLWIRYQNYHPPHQELLLETLNAYWNRIQVLKLTSDTGSQVLIQDREEGSVPFFRPAPNLHTFELNVIDGNDIPELATLFSSDAPMLRIFRFAIRNTLLFNRSKWLENLEVLRTGVIGEMQTLLKILGIAKNLKSLHIGAIESQEGSLSSIELPRLQHLKTFWNNPVVLSTFFSQVILPPVIRLDCCVAVDGQEPFLALLPRLSTFTRRYFQINVPKYIHLTCHNTVFCLFAGTRPMHPDDAFEIHVQEYPFPQTTAAALLTTFSTPELTSVTRLKLTMDMGFPKTELLRFMTCLPNIATIVVDLSAVEQLVELQRGQQACLFSTLVTIVFIGDSEGTEKAGALLDSVLEFIILFRDAGSPIVTLDLSHSNDVNLNMHMKDHPLREVSDLKVIWTSQSFQSA